MAESESKNLHLSRVLHRGHGLDRAEVSYLDAGHVRSQLASPFCTLVHPISKHRRDRLPWSLNLWHGSHAGPLAR